MVLSSVDFLSVHFSFLDAPAAKSGLIRSRFQQQPQYSSHVIQVHQQPQHFNMQYQQSWDDTSKGRHWGQANLLDPYILVLEQHLRSLGNSGETNGRYLCSAYPRQKLDYCRSRGYPLSKLSSVSSQVSPRVIFLAHSCSSLIWKSPHGRVVARSVPFAVFSCMFEFKHGYALRFSNVTSHF
jgi:hypothetical protein